MTPSEKFLDLLRARGFVRGSDLQASCLELQEACLRQLLRSRKIAPTSPLALWTAEEALNVGGPKGLKFLKTMASGPDEALAKELAREAGFGDVDVRAASSRPTMCHWTLV